MRFKLQTICLMSTESLHKASWFFFSFFLQFVFPLWIHDEVIKTLNYIQSQLTSNNHQINNVTIIKVSNNWLIKNSLCNSPGLDTKLYCVASSIINNTSNIKVVFLSIKKVKKPRYLSSTCHLLGFVGLIFHRFLLLGIA